MYLKVLVGINPIHLKLTMVLIRPVSRLLLRPGKRTKFAMKTRPICQWLDKLCFRYRDEKGVQGRVVVTTIVSAEDGPRHFVNFNCNDVDSISSCLLVLDFRHIPFKLVLCERRHAGR